MDSKNEIIESLKPLFEEAIEKGLWFYCIYQDVWFSPGELQEQHKRNKFVWGAPNWILKRPQELVQQYERQIDHCNRMIQQTHDRVAREMLNKMYSKDYCTYCLDEEKNSKDCPFFKCPHK